jgi:hypothetical protein
MAVCAARRVRLGIMRGTELGDRVAARANSGLTGSEQILAARTVGRMTMSTILDDGQVFVDPWSDLRRVTRFAKRRGRAEFESGALVRAMAVRATEHAFADGVMGRQIQARSDFCVTAQTKLRGARRTREDHYFTGIRSTQVPWFSIVRIVAIRAEESGSGMLRRRPTEMCRATALVAVEAVAIARKPDAIVSDHVFDVALSGAVAAFAIAVWTRPGLVSVACVTSLCAKQYRGAFDRRCTFVARGRIGYQDLRAGDDASDRESEKRGVHSEQPPGFTRSAPPIAS